MLYKKLLKKLKEEKGAVAVIEMTLILPIVFLIIAFLFFMGSYILQSVTINSYAQQIAMGNGIPSNIAYDITVTDELITVHATKSLLMPSLIKALGLNGVLNLSATAVVDAQSPIDFIRDVDEKFE